MLSRRYFFIECIEYMYYIIDYRIYSKMPSNKPTRKKKSQGSSTTSPWGNAQNEFTELFNGANTLLAHAKETSAILRNKELSKAIGPDGVKELIGHGTTLVARVSEMSDQLKNIGDVATSIAKTPRNEREPVLWAAPVSDIVGVVESYEGAILPTVTAINEMVEQAGITSPATNENKKQTGEVDETE